MPLNGPEALGWALAVLVVSLVLGHAQATFLFSLYGSSFSLALVMSCVMWGTFLGLPSWHGIFAAYQEYHIRLGRFHKLRVRAAVTIEAREVPALPRNERLALPRWNPPSYQALEIRDLDLEADLDLVPPYPMSPQGYPMVLSEPFDLSVEETQELHRRWVEMQPQHRASHVGIIETALAMEKASTMDDPSHKRYVEHVIGFIEEIYLPKCPDWRHAISQHRTQYTRSPFPWHVIPSIAVEQTWESIPRNFIDRCPEDEPLVNQKVHLTFHGFLVNCLPKISAASTLHAHANFNGIDIPSLFYEDPALETVPALALTNDTFFYFRGRDHPGSSDLEPAS
ncbi:hypothetical protein PISMIDRAFT_20196 [Pisolithus microcarpus 441]|uniref:Uncharacterized protein n=1 Tax=Pisolithus microcarpus 441 TaxID=765257 RepID=A0A0C9YRK8_9AGAM|nr:hypothetical protein PISMIDRAFT_20196 [Pisolithus microcarpus 441]